MTGGSSYEVHVEHAAAAIAAGVCDVVVSVYAATPRSDRTGPPGVAAVAGGAARRSQPDGRVGPALRPAHPMGPYALAASRHMYQYGTTAEQLAQIAVAPGSGPRATRGPATATR